MPGLLRHQVVDHEQVERPLGQQALTPSRARGVVTTSCPSSRRARPRVLRIFSSSSTSEDACRTICGQRVPIAGPWPVRSGIRCRARAGSDADACRPAPRRCSWRSPGPGRCPSRRVVKYGSNTRGRSSAGMPAPRSRTVSTTCRPTAARCRRRSAAAARRRSGRPSTACCALVSRFTSTVRRRSAIGRRAAAAAVRSSPTAGWARPPPRRPPAERADVVDVGRRALEADRPGEVEHLVDQRGSGARPPR